MGLFKVGDKMYAVDYIHQLPMDTHVEFFDKSDALHFHDHILEDPLCFGSTVTETTVIGRRMKRVV
jgi:hypothetical protein